MSYCATGNGGYSAASGCYSGSSGSYATNAAQKAYLPVEQMYAHSLDTIVNSHALVEKHATVPAYVPSSAKGAYVMLHAPHEYFIADTFLKPGSTAKFIGNAADIKDEIHEAFRATTNIELPEDIVITVLDDKQFAQAFETHNGHWNDSVQGFSLNANGRGTSQVFARASQLDRLMLTIGHEIGHVLTPTLKDARDEEAKAFAFSLAWINTIREKNIAGIGSNILPSPAENGLHDTAFAFVQHIMEQGISAWEAFVQLARGTLTIREQPLTMEA
jgi:hypothetical protein